MISHTPWTLHSHRSRAERLRDELAAQLPADAVADALRRGRERSYDDTVVAALASQS